MHDTLRFWLDRGVDGFRMDVVHCIGKDPALPDVAAELAGVPMALQHDDPRTHALVRDLRGVLEDYDGERMMVGEVVLLSTAQVARYYGRGDGLHLAFNFLPLFAPWQERAWRERIVEIEDTLGPQGAWPTWVLSNHDNARHRTRYGSERARVPPRCSCSRCAGTPFLYAGEELGLEDAQVTGRRARGPRRARRLPGADPMGGASRSRLGRSHAVVAVAAGCVEPERRGAARRRRIDPPSVPAALGRAPCVARAPSRHVDAGRGAARRPRLSPRVR